MKVVGSNSDPLGIDTVEGLRVGPACERLSNEQDVPGRDRSWSSTGLQ